MTKLVPSLKQIGKIFTMIVFLTGSTVFLFGTANEPCTASAADGAGHAVWLSDYDGENTNFHFEGKGGELVENGDGTASVVGTIYDKKNKKDRWKVEVWLSDGMTWEQWSALGRGYKDEQNIAGDLYKTWTYYIMDPAKTSALIGLGDNEGTMIPLQHNPTDYHYGFQVGQAANSKNGNYGVSGWILYTKGNNDPLQGDFNLDLECQKDDPKGCPDCFSSEFISSVQTSDGCTEYTFEVSNDGSCAHALSHYTVAVPCGTVSNISNSEGWKVEIGKDPTTGLDGFKIDDISGFGESGDPGSFTVTFTLCGDNSECRDFLNSWETEVAYKAGQCITTQNFPTESPVDDPHDNPQDCQAKAADGAGHAVWLNSYLNGQSARFIFDDNGGSVTENQDGTAHISGTIVSDSDPEDQWQVDLWLADVKDWEAWSALGRGYKDEQNIAGDLYKSWSYYIMDLNKTSQLIGKGKNQGEVLPLMHNPTDYHYGFQIGESANSKNSNYGVSGWFLYTRNGQTYNGDFNLDLDCEVQPTPDCDVNELAADFSSSDVSCYGAQDGAIDLTVTGGLAPFTFVWSNSASTQDISNLGPGNYSVSITDANGSTLELAGTVFEPAELSVTGMITPLDCGAANGSISSTVSGGTAPFTYSWSNGSSSMDISGLAAGTYDLTVMDANGCAVTESFTLVATSDISAAISTNSCNDGALMLEVTGGGSPYTYLWSNGETTRDINVDATGDYSVTVTDVNGCSTTASITLDQLDEFSLSVTTVIPTCGGNSDGSIDLTVSGGVAPLTYSWSNGATTEDLTNVISGNYTVTVTDARGCSQQLTHFLRNPVSTFISADVTGIRCDGAGTDGTIDISIFNAAAPYTVSWSNGATTEDLSDLAAGLYTITVTDANGCQATRTIEIELPEDFEVDLSQQYCGDGKICPTLTGGTGPFTYNWTDGSNNPISTIDGCIEVTAAGTYTVQIVDVNGCTKTSTITIDAPNPPLSTDLVVTDLNCAGANDASADLTITGGEAPYTITWSTGATTEDVAGLGSGTYTVRVEDVNGCSQFRAFNVQEPQGMEISATAISEVSCDGESDGSIDISIVNGAAPFTYSWSNGTGTEDLVAIAAGSYTVTVTDANGCSAMMTYVVTVNPDSTNCTPDDGGDGGDGGDGDPGDGDGDGDGNGDGDPCVRDCNVCDGKISILTLKYLGDQENAQITVKQKKDGQIVFDAVVQPDGEFTFQGMDDKGTLSTEVILIIDGMEDSRIHTSCSQPVGPGTISGDFEVIYGESRNGGPLCPVEPGTQPDEDPDEDEEPGNDDCSDCDGKITVLTLKYQGQESANITVVQKKGEDVVFDEIVAADGEFTFQGVDKKGTLSTEIIIYINGEEHTRIHTSCSKPIGPGLISGDFQVLSGESRNGGLLCELEPGTVQDSEQEEEAPITFIKYKMYPNPSKSGDYVNIEFTHANIGDELAVHIKGITGNNCYSGKVEISREKEIFPLKLTGINPGVYFLTVTSRHKVYTEKLIIK